MSNEIKIDITDNSKMVKDALEKAIHRGLVAIGLTAERHAKEDADMPVDTGRARNSITYAVAGEQAHIQTYSGDHGEEGGTYSGVADGKKDSAVYLGSNVSYFPTIELGGRYMRARHVLRNAASGHTAEYKELFEESLKNA